MLSYYMYIFAAIILIKSICFIITVDADWLVLPFLSGGRLPRIRTSRRRPSGCFVRL